MKFGSACLAAAVTSLFFLSYAVAAAAGKDREDSSSSSDNNQMINFVAIGDWGGKELFPYWTQGQKEAAEGMSKVSTQINSKFVVALGDNFYHKGVTKPTSFRFDWTFERVYHQPSLQEIPWYVIGGNHDHYGNITAQIEYHRDERWNFPSLYHSHSFDSEDKSVTLDLILIDTVELCGLNDVQNEEEPGYFDALPLKEKSEAQEQWGWIENQLKESTADYVLVGGHYPVYSVCSHGPTETLIQHLLPLLQKYGAHYLSGHDHCMVHFEEEKKGKEKRWFGVGATGNADDDHVQTTTHHVLTGMGDECCYKAENLNNNTKNPPSGALKWFIADENKDLYKNPNGGFTSFQLTSAQMIIEYHDQDGNVIFKANPVLPRKWSNKERAS